MGKYEIWSKENKDISCPGLAASSTTPQVPKGSFWDHSTSAITGTGVEKFERIFREDSTILFLIHADPPAPPCDQGPTLQSKGCN